MVQGPQRERVVDPRQDEELDRKKASLGLPRTRVVETGCTPHSAAVSWETGEKA